MMSDYNFQEISNPFTNSVNPDEIPQYAVFHPGLQCLQKCPFRGSRIQRIETKNVHENVVCLSRL